MSSIKLLDCTLRDGGYINDWNFGYDTIKIIINKLIRSKVDYIELGFLRNSEYDRNKTLFTSCKQIKEIMPEKKGKTLYTAMALYNKFDLRQLEPYDGDSIDAIRITFHNYDVDEGLEYITKVMALGYKVFVNPINIMGYTDTKLLDLISKVNRIKPYAFSIVDTFGSMMKDDLHRIYSLIEHNLDKDIVVGLHLHENLSLSFSLAQDFISMKSSSRECIIDASMLGMGRVPGNLCMELIMDYMNKYESSDYDVNPVLDAIDDNIIRFKEIENWGYNTAYAISAKYNLHRNYAEFLLNKGRLRAKHINQILGQISDEKKAAYDRGYIEALYNKFQNNKIDDRDAFNLLKKEMHDKKILIIAPGNSIVDKKNQIDEFIINSDPIVISANFIPEDKKLDYVFCSNAMRYDLITNNIVNSKMIVTSNLLGELVGVDNIVLDYEELSDVITCQCDNSVIMMINMLVKMGISEVYLAGFDGYSDNSENYYDKFFTNLHTNGIEENREIKKVIEILRGKIDLKFLTPSMYQ